MSPTDYTRGLYAAEPIPLPKTLALSVRQVDALRAYAETGNYPDAADRMGVTLQTFKNHMSDAYRRLGAVSAIDAFRVLGWLNVTGIKAVVSAQKVADIEARLAAIHSETGAMLAELRRAA